MMMNRRLNRESPRGSLRLQKKVVESHGLNKPEQAPDLTDFMNDMFFGTANNDKVKAYNLTGNHLDDDDEPSFDDSTRSNSSRLTQEWLEEAKRMMASSATLPDSPSRRAGSPRFAGAVPGRLSTSSVLEKRDPLSRSARRQRAVEGFSGEILIKSVKHSRNKSETYDNRPGSPEPSFAYQAQQWFSNSHTDQSTDSPTLLTDPTAPTVPPRLSAYRKSRFQTEPPVAPTPQGVPVPSRRTFKTAPLQDTELLSPPKHLIESPQRRSISSSTCAQLENELLSPPRTLVESNHRRSIARSTCSTRDKIAPKASLRTNGWQKENDQGETDINLNKFLKEKRIKIEKILNGEISSKAKVILSGPSNSTSSMVAAICYAWLLENRIMKNKEGKNREDYVVVPVMNIRRGKMWKQRQAAWLFHHVGLDAASLLFADEVDLESLIMEGKLSILVVGQDILKTDTEDRSQCTILTDNYCEDAYDLLQTSILKKVLLAGILLETKNLSASTKMSMTRDAEAVQLLSVGSNPNYRNTLFDQLMQDQRDHAFFEALTYNYGKPPSEGGLDRAVQMETKGAGRKSTYVSPNEITSHNSDKKSKDVKNILKTNKDIPAVPKPAPAPAPATTPESSRGKNRFFLAKWFGFGK